MRASACLDRADAEARAPFRPPDLPSNAVDRPRLTAQLDLAFEQHLTLVVAPSGAGKTVTLSQWAHAQPPGQVRWVTLTERHNDTDHLVRDLWSALGVRRPPRRLAFPAAVSRALQDLAPVALVLDDFGVLTDPSALSLVAALIESTPPSLHVVIATRIEPPLPYYRLGLSGVRVEIRQEALTFSRPEGAQLLRRSTGPSVSEAQIGMLVRRTEGWAAGLELAARALADQDDGEDVVVHFDGDDAGVAAYLDEHVLRGQPAEVQQFLLHTCVLREMTGPLCDAVTNRPGAAAMLEALRRACICVVTNGADGRFRYHQLLRSRLRRLLRESTPELERELLMRAAAWHLARDHVEEGVAYLIDAGAWDEVLDTAFAAGPALLADGNAAAVARWIDQVPPAARGDRADVLLLAAAAHLFGDAPGRARAALDAVDDLPRPSAGTRVVADLLRSYAALRAGAVGAAVAAADRVGQAIASVPEAELPDVLGLTGRRDDIVVAAEVVRGVALLFDGRLDEARTALERGRTHGAAVWQVTSRGALALLECWAGRFRRAEHLGLEALTMTAELGLHDAASTTCAFLALATVARDREEFDRARMFLDEAARRSGPSPLVGSVVATESALLLGAEGRPEVGLRVLAARTDADHPSMPAALVARRRAAQGRLLIMTGNLAGAEVALDDAPRAVATEVASAQMRLALERGELATVRELGARWPSTSTPRARIERQVWSAIQHYLEGDESASRIAIAAAVADAELERDLGPFRMAGPHVLGPARSLYRAAPTPFARAIVDEPATPGPPRQSAELIEQLTRREYLVLSLLPTRLSNAEIADRLDVSLNTVKTHLKHIYRKLDAPGRREAVGAAEKLRLL